MDNIESIVSEDTVTTYTAICGNCRAELAEWVDDYTVNYEIKCECCGKVNDVSVAY